MHQRPIEQDTSTFNTYHGISDNVGSFVASALVRDRNFV